MYARTARQLRKLIAKNPGESPSVFLPDQSFAAFCYDRYTAADLKSAFNRDPDPDDCRKWRLSPSEWRENIEMAFIARSEAERR
ncbi:MAG: hypothetical protein R6U50_15130 [Desulfobacterales bacterium]